MAADVALHGQLTSTHLFAAFAPKLQAESGQRAAAQSRQQLAAQQQQLEAQSLAAAEATAEAARLRERLRQAEMELGRALADRADLSDAGREAQGAAMGACEQELPAPGWQAGRSAGGHVRLG